MGSRAEILTNAGMIRNRFSWQEPLRPERGNEIGQIGEAHEEVDFRDFTLQLVLVPLDQTTDYGDGLDLARLLQLGNFQYRLDRFLFGGVYESTGIDQNHIGLRDVALQARPTAHELTDQSLRVHSGLVTAQ